MICHVDMDAFFASVEQLDNPELVGKPVAVAGRAQRAVVSTASYEAREFGVCSAMPVVVAKRLCPNLIIVPASKARYKSISSQIIEIFNNFSPLVEQVSIDEAYLDITGCQRLLGSEIEIARQIKYKIFCQLGLTCSIGIAPLKFLSKIASEMQKPDGLTIIPESSTQEIIASLSIEKVPGVGTHAMKQIKALQIKTLGDVSKFPLKFLEQKLGKRGIRLHQLSLGMDANCVDPVQARKSISSESTLSYDIVDYEPNIRKQLLIHSHAVGKDLRSRHLICFHVSIKIKFNDFTQVTRGQKLEEGVCSSEAILEYALNLYKKVKINKKIRLLGIVVSHLKYSDTAIQQVLFQDYEQKLEHKWKPVDSAIDAIERKFGRNSLVVKASLAESDII